jgi:hypothetical protein
MSNDHINPIFASALAPFAAPAAPPASYDDIANIWPEQLPELNAKDAENFIRVLYWKFIGDPFVGTVRITSGKHPSWIYGQGGSAVLWLNPDKGWPEIVHRLSHCFHQMLSGFPAHGSSHAQLEASMARYVIDSGWLS